MFGEYLGRATDGVLPNIVGDFVAGSIGAAYADQVLFKMVETAGGYTTGKGYYGFYNGKITFNANHYNAKYGAGWYSGGRVIPASTGMLMCIKY